MSRHNRHKTPGPSAPTESMTEAQEAIRMARRAKTSAQAIIPVAIRTAEDLRSETLGLADLMENYANELRKAIEGESSD